MGLGLFSGGFRRVQKARGFGFRVLALSGSGFGTRQKNKRGWCGDTLVGGAVSVPPFFFGGGGGGNEKSDKLLRQGLAS